MLEKNNKTEKDLFMYLGISNGSFTHWKYTESKSYMQYVAKIAEYIEATVNYMIYGVDEEVSKD